MKKLIPSYVRVPLIFALVMGAMEYFIDSGDKPAFIEYPMVALFLGVFLFLLVAIEIVVSAVDKVTYHMLSEEQKKQLEEAQSLPFTESAFYQSLSKKLTRSKEIEEEHDILLDHDYDGIKELDNVLPPWWVNLFYLTIIFAIIYLVRFHIYNDYDQASEFETEMAIAKAEVEKYKLTAPDLMDKDKVTLLTDATALAEGKKLYETNCVACHKPDGGGSIGPNLTDEHWILGGGIKNVFNTLMEGGREGKGMVSWKATIKPSDLQKVASYVLSLQGTNPPDAKPAEGDIWVDENAPKTETSKDSTVTDSTKTVAEVAIK
ncbi:MAG TPA: cbb3-type cytochrome c oxidase N-terminal domain-containing protein [Flavobacterium sp.]|uniref:cbb3-type cytochrome c oxidase N-terminal domain-containing protein n=1 Tax=unclassified Flavobacterium TaxID=196869 RepID=UPI000E900A82|nr:MULTISPECIES: cbb3-type cytochrome c oxidase N-terminal domain-containing protein [unclassified Flavobacterium]HBI01148.1 cytochrome C oxidase subunit III [Flavobacterium sp.]HRE77198.1 cbb3-type cytochrome c oxidase N-terminal domain-containing protein [Flavobacterium sp.]